VIPVVSLFVTSDNIWLANGGAMLLVTDVTVVGTFRHHLEVLTGVANLQANSWWWSLTHALRPQ